MDVAEVFPAYAGMILGRRFYPTAHLSVPRIRGDDPCVADSTVDKSKCSPHTRG